MECGREPGGSNSEVLGICPASTELRFDGINDSNFAGRFYWQVAGTFCDTVVQGTFAAKIKDCLKCPFFLIVVRQEGKSLIFIKERRHSG
jgi:hypothetical protein